MLKNKGKVVLPYFDVVQHDQIYINSQTTTEFQRVVYIYITFTFMHLADAFIQSDLHCIQVTVLHLTSSCFPWESNP